MQPKKIAVYAVTAKGAELARKIALKFDASCYVADRYAQVGDNSILSLKTIIAEKFHKYDSHIFIAACGIVVRLCAPYLVHKSKDPAVVVMDQQAKFAISLISGHLGGANELATALASEFNAEPVITTATDSSNTLSIDMVAKDKGLKIGNYDQIKDVNACFLDDIKVGLYDPDGYLDDINTTIFEKVSNVQDLHTYRAGVCVDYRKKDELSNVLYLFPKCLRLGIGCRRGTSCEDISNLIRSVFKESGLDLRAAASISSVDLKSDEKGLLEAAEKLNLDINFYTAEELDVVKTANPSGMVLKHIGVKSVCEAAAMIRSNNNLLVEKKKSKCATLAIAKDQ